MELDFIGPEVYAIWGSPLRKQNTKLSCFVNFIKSLTLRVLVEPLSPHPGLRGGLISFSEKLLLVLCLFFSSHPRVERLVSFSC